MIGRKTLKQLLIGLLSGFLILTACAQRATITPVTVTQESIVTPSPIPTSTNTFIPTATLTASNTPLPTIPTFTPTFDASTIVTVTPALPAVCPKENPEIVADFSGPYIYNSDEILTYLNSGGSLAQLAIALSARDPDSSWGKIIDLTGDGLSEIVYRGLVRYDILGCKGGKYQNLFDFAGDFGVSLEGTPDLDKNGIIELILYDISHYGFALLYVFEWDGSKFRSLIDSGGIDSILVTSTGKIMDTNGDGLKEMVIVDDVHEREGWVFGGGDVTVQRPLRNQTTILGWNGQNLVDLKQGNNAPPQYRFQAIQDGDEQVRYGNYTAALSFYQAAIFDDRLEWWSPKRREYEIYIYMSRFDAKPTVYPTPNPDNTEYHRVAAYAYYRIMLLHLVQRHEADAGTVYKTLGQKFSNNPYGRPYFEMATAFWDAHQSTHKMYDSCAAAISYAAEHPGILIPLGSDYHGGYSHTYVPADVCPLR